MRALLALRMVNLVTVVIAMMIVPVYFAGQSVPNPVPPAPVPTQISSAKKVFVSNAGGDELDPRRFDFSIVDPNLIYNQLYWDRRCSNTVRRVSMSSLGTTTGTPKELTTWTTPGISSMRRRSAAGMRTNR